MLYMKALVLSLLTCSFSIYAQDDFLVFIGEFVETKQVPQNIPEGYITFSVKDRTVYKVIDVFSEMPTKKIIKSNQELIIYSYDHALVDKHQYHKISLIVAKKKGAEYVLQNHFQMHKTKNGSYASCANEPLIYGYYQHIDTDAKSIDFNPPIVIEYITYLTQDYINDKIKEEGLYLDKGRLVCGIGLYASDIYEKYSNVHNKGDSHEE